MSNADKPIVSIDESRLARVMQIHLLSLIAAAPDLLAALHEFEQLITSDSDDLGFHLRVVPISVEAVKRVRAALAKAVPS